LSEGYCVLDVDCYDGNFLSKLPNKIKKVEVYIEEPATKEEENAIKGQKYIWQGV
jgi:hypothetical protein